jgi:dsDNA-specific endonuclease/ATPase MutS2
MSPIPWGALLSHGPAIVSAARSLLTSQSKTVTDRHTSLEARVEQLEKTSMETARLLQEMAEQLQALTLAEQELQRRLRLALIVSGAATIIAISAFIYAAVS